MNIKYRYLVLIIAIIASFNVFAQVGIGTTSPHPSSIFDVESDSQGMLTPRMSTQQRTEILQPAKGLLVFDTDLNAFYFFDGGQWLELGTESKTRNNYKLVQSVADLADELTAGGGSKYLLNPFFLYEINGNVVFNFPIELNGAYIKGEDSVEDKIINGTGSTLFVGTTGGNLKRMTIVGNGQKIFNLNGDGSQNLIFLSVNFVNSSSVGSLSGFSIIFFNVGQFQNNSNGLIVSNSESFFFTLYTWATSNTGTFLTLNGAIDEVQLSNARVVADAGEVGINVSANPSISGSASIAQVTFAGAGNHVLGYSSGTYPNYHFTNKWFVSCHGIAQETDDNATGDINLSTAVGAGATTSFTGIGISSRVKLAGATTSSNLFRFTKSGNNRIVYDGLKSRSFNVSTSISFQASANNTVFIFYLAKNGIIIENTRVYRQSSGVGDIGAVALVGSVFMNSNDFLELYVERYSGSGSLETVSLNMIAE
ncbi:hypothetical protein SAMN03097699_0722 [Flavobacteriaceae bacterium MAR_2010_188]|nr:hypothetical protein SAMN03097699_0722 [Flavobacteriaceae bacterium MAR_2010_188]